MTTIPDIQKWLWVPLLGGAFVVGWIVSLGLDLPAYYAIALLLVLFPILFLKPYWGLITLLIIRTGFDIFSQTVQVEVYEDLFMNLAAILGVVVLIWGVVYLLQHRQTIFKKLPLLYPFLIFIGVALISVAYATEPFTAGTEWIRWLTIFLVFAIAFDLVKREKRWRGLLYAILASAIAPVVVALWQLATGTGIYERQIDMVRIHGTFAHPNSLAFYLVLVFTILGAFWLQKGASNTNPKRYWLLLPILFAMAMIAVTYTRGAWLALAIVIAFMGLVKWKWKFLVVVLIVVAVLGSVGLISQVTSRPGEFTITKTELFQRITDTFEMGERTSVSWRVDMWGDMITGAFPEKPILGWGVGMFSETANEVRGLFEGSPYAHNDYLKILIELGVVGLAAFIFLVGSAIYQTVKALKQISPDYKSFALALLALLIALAAVSFADNIVRSTALQWALWTFVAVVLALTKLNPKTS